MRVTKEEVNGDDIGHVQDELRLHRVRWNFRLVYGFDDSEVTLVTSSFSLLSKPILYLFQIQWAFHWMNYTGLVPLLIPVRISSWIIPILILRHRTVREMMEDQVIISICMDMKGMRNGLLSSPIASFPDPSILWLYLMDHRAHATHPSFPYHSVPSLLQPRHRSHPHHRPLQLACLSSGIPPVYPDDLSDKP